MDVLSRIPASRRTPLLVVLIVACAFLAHWSALGGTYVYDDFHSVRDNDAIRSLANIPSFFWDVDAFSGSSARMYRPFLLSTLAVDHALGGGSPIPFKITDLLIHAMTAVLVFAVARRLRVGLRGAAFAGVLFAVHPLAAEAVNYISSRSDQLLALGILLAIRGVIVAQVGHRSGVVVAAVATAIACGAKETGVVVPAVLVAVEVTCWVRGRTTVRAAALRVAPAVAVAVGYLIARRLLFGVATVAVPRLGGGDVGDPALGASRDLVTQLATMGSILPRFVAQSFVPLGLSADPYVPSGSSFADPLVWIGWASIGLLTVLGIRAPRRRPAAFVGTCVAWAVALPWVVIPLNSPANEHRVYGALAGILIAGAVLLPRVLPRRESVRALAVVAICVACGGASLGRGFLFHDPRTLWQNTLDGNPTSAAALRGLAQACQDDAKSAFERGEDEAARRAVRSAIDYAYRALALQPRSHEVLSGLVRYHLVLGAEHGWPMLGVVHAEAIVARRPKDPFARLQASRALAQAGVATGEGRFFDEADRAAMSVLDIAEPKGLVYRVAAEARVLQGDLVGALARLDESLARGLDHRSVRLDRADVLLRMGRASDALAIVRAALQEAPFDPQALGLAEQMRAAPPR